MDVKTSLGTFTTDVGFAFLSMAKWLLRHGLNIDVKECDSLTLKAKAREATQAEQWCWDGRYYYTDLETWKRIILNRTHVEQIRYIREKRDCENIAEILHSRISEIFELNAFATVIGAVFRNDRLIGYHGWNAFYCDEGVFFVEPQNDLIAKCENGRAKLGDLVYIPHLLIWY